MQTISTDFKQALEQNIRAQTFLEINCDLIDTDAVENATHTDNGYEYFSNPVSYLTTKAVNKNPVATFEKGRYMLNDILTVASENSFSKAEGFVSNALCGEDGVFETPPLIEINFSQTCTVPALTFVFGVENDALPKQCVIKIYSSNDIILQKEIAPTEHMFLLDENIENFDKITIEFIKMNKAYNRARLQRLLFGYSAVFTDNNLCDAKVVWQRDPLMRNLPTESLNFSISINNSLTGDGENQEYNPENPQGVWQFLVQPCPVHARMGMQTNAGVQWLEIGEFLLKSEPTSTEITLSLCAEGALAFLTNNCVDSTYSGQERSFYELAQIVLEQNNLPKSIYANAEYNLWSGLNDIYTSAPLPQKPLKECLQYIAHATNCVVYTNRYGEICIEQIDDAQQDIYLDFNLLLAKPTISQINLLNSVFVNIYTYNLQDDGTYQSSEEKYELVNETALQGAKDETVSNPLITSESVAISVAQNTKNYLQKRYTYTSEYRGFPQLDALDYIKMCSSYTDNASVLLLKNELSLCNGVTGSIIAKKIS